MIAGAITSCTFATAFSTPFPPNRAGSPSRSSRASYSPVEAPEGTAERPRDPSSSHTSISIVGFPRESRISRARTESIWDIGLQILGRGPPRPGISHARLMAAGARLLALLWRGATLRSMDEQERPEPCCFDEWAVHSASRARKRGVGAPITGRLLGV